MQEMENVILGHLRDIEQEHDVKVLLAVARGFIKQLKTGFKIGIHPIIIWNHIK